MSFLARNRNLAAAVVCLASILGTRTSWAEPCEKAFRSSEPISKTNSYYEIDVYRRGNVAKNSITAQMGIKFVRVSSGWRVRIPTVETANRNLGLDGSSFEIVTLPQMGLVDDLAIMRAIALGKFGVSGVGTDTVSQGMFKHDMKDHAPGFYILSRTEHWPRVISLASRMVELQGVPSARTDLGWLLESVTQRLTMADQTGDASEISQLLNSLGPRIDFIETKLETYLSSGQQEVFY